MTTFRWRDALLDSRGGRVVAGGISGASARVLGLAGGLLIVPMALDHLGRAEFGVFLALTSVITVLAVFDAGLGNAVISPISRAAAYADRARIADITSSATAAATALAVALGTVVLVATSVIPWPSIARDPEVAQRTRQAAVIIALGVVVRLVLSVTSSVRSALQQSHVANAWVAAGHVLTIVGIAGAVWRDADLPVLIAVVVAAPLLGLVGNSITLWMLAPETRPSPAHVTWMDARALARRGFLFFVLQISAVVGFSSDTIVAALVLGPEAATRYGVPFRLASAIVAVLTIAAAPLWPAFVDAVERRDTSWVRARVRSAIAILGTLAIAGAIVLVVGTNFFLRIWVGPEISASLPLRVGFAAWVLTAAGGGVIAAVLAAFDQLRLQALLSVAFAFANIAASVVLCRQVGVAGLIWATVATYVTIVLVPLAVRVRRILKDVVEEDEDRMRVPVENPEER